MSTWLKTKKRKKKKPSKCELAKFYTKKKLARKDICKWTEDQFEKAEKVCQHDARSLYEFYFKE